MLRLCRYERKRPFFGDLGATYDDHLRLIEKLVLMLIGFFSLGVTAEGLRTNIW